MERESFIVYRSFYGLTKLLKPKERLEMYEAIFNYGFDMVEPKFAVNSTQFAIWQAISPQLKANNKRYVNSLKGGAPRNNQNAKNKTTEKQPNYDEKNNLNSDKKTTKKQPNENVNENDNVNVNDNLKRERYKEKKEAEQVGAHTTRFIKPTLEEVEDYCRERHNNVNAQRFIDFYQSKGWKIGKETMRDWKACVRTWEQREDTGQKDEKEKAWQDMSPLERQRHMESILGDS